MAFLLRLLSAVGLGVVTFAAVLVSIIIVVFVVNRGLQIFVRLFGYEMGDFFGWLMKKMGFKKINKEEKNGT